MASSSLERIRDQWLTKWEEALSVWSRFTKLSPPRFCLDKAAEKAEGLDSSFAMIKLDRHTVVISIRQIADQGLADFPLEIMGHEIGHHVYCPADLADQGRLLARIRRGLPTKEDLAGFVSNLYTDLLINDRLARVSGLRMGDIYKTLGGGSTDSMWTFYMRIYEILWNLPKGSLATGAIDQQLDVDAGLGARVIRIYAKDWLKGAGRFAALCFPYLEKNNGSEVRKLLKGFLDTHPHPIDGAPDGLAEIDDDELEGAIHPALDEEISGVKKSDAKPTASSQHGDETPRKRYREPLEYADILNSLGVKLSPEEMTIRYYRERAIPYLVKFPERQLPETTEPLPEGLGLWEATDAIEELDTFESMLRSPLVIPGVTTVQRTYGVSTGSEPLKEAVDLYIGIDCSGSMTNPRMSMSHPVLAGVIVAVSALRAGARVMAMLSGEPGQYHGTSGFIRDEHEILSVLTGYLGTGYSFGIHRLTPTFAERKESDRPAHILIVTDHDIFAMLGEKNGGIDGWTAAKEAVAKARGGGTYILHMPAGWEKQEARMQADGWKIHHVVQWEDIVEFARKFSQETYG